MVKKTKRSIQWVRQDNQLKYAGAHWLIEFWGAKIIEDSKKVEKILIVAAKKAKNTPLKVVIHKFNPKGITGVVLLAESHIALHSWPEIDYLAIDIFTCGKKSFPGKALNYFKKEFKPKKVVTTKIKRGII